MEVIALLLALAMIAVGLLLLLLKAVSECTITAFLSLCVGLWFGKSMTEKRNGKS
jgi:hypothetical protein